MRQLLVDGNLLTNDVERREQQPGVYVKDIGGKKDMLLFKANTLKGWIKMSRYEWNNLLIILYHHPLQLCLQPGTATTRVPVEQFCSKNGTHPLWIIEQLLWGQQLTGKPCSFRHFRPLLNASLLSLSSELKFASQKTPPTHTEIKFLSPPLYINNHVLYTRHLRKACSAKVRDCDEERGKGPQVKHVSRRREFRKKAQTKKISLITVLSKDSRRYYFH